MPNDNMIQCIELSLPVNPAYVSAARMTASSVAGRLGFDADEVEDVRSAVSEACTYVIGRTAGKDGYFKLVFGLKKDYVEITLTCPAIKEIGRTNDDYSLPLIRGLMDLLSIASDDGVFKLVMQKCHKTVKFE